MQAKVTKLKQFKNCVNGKNTLLEALISEVVCFYAMAAPNRVMPVVKSTLLDLGKNLIKKIFIECFF